MDKTLFCILSITFSLISILSSSLVIWAHIKIPLLRKHPGQMIIAICIVQFFVDIQWLTIFSAVKRVVLDAGICEYFSKVFIFFIFASWNVFSFLIIELIIKIKYPLSTNYSYRNKVYLILTILISSTEFAPVVYFGGFGFSIGDTCYIENDSISNWFILIPVFVNIPINVIGLVILQKTIGYDQNRALQKLILTSYVMCFCLGVPMLAAGMYTVFHYENRTILEIALLIGNCSGSVLAICRLCSVKMLKKLFNSSPKRKKKAPEKSLAINDELVEETSVSIFFQDITSDKFKELLVSLCLALEPKPYCKAHYCIQYQKYKHVFKREKYENFLKDYRLKFDFEQDEVWEYGRDYFLEIKKHCGICCGKILESFKLCENFRFVNSNTAGRSGAFIISTADGKFILKIVNTNERLLLLNILPAYTERIKSGNSNIVRILGLYKVKSSKCSFIIMENVIEEKNKAAVFDLKGSTDNRYIEVQGDIDGTVLKDQNFLEIGMKIATSNIKRSEFLMGLKQDLEFFERNNIIDYSLLIGFYNEDEAISNRYKFVGADKRVCVLGIIDFLQEYSLKKRLELLFKRLKGKVNISVSSPHKYSKRFFEFVRDHLFQIVSS